MSDTRFSHLHYTLAGLLGPRKAIFIAHCVTFLTDQQPNAEYSARSSRSIVWGALDRHVESLQSSQRINVEFLSILTSDSWPRYAAGGVILHEYWLRLSNPLANWLAERFYWQLKANLRQWGSVAKTEDSGDAKVWFKTPTCDLWYFIYDCLCYLSIWFDLNINQTV